MTNREPFAPGEWYHCYNRGVDKRQIFNTARDYQRFIQTLYVCNSVESVRIDNLRNQSHNEILQIPREKTHVAIGAYCLMPNHFHLLLKETVEGGISKFMQKLSVSYTMYFNIKNDRSGNLLNRPFRSRRISSDAYLKQVVQYIHLNPAELFEGGWKKGEVKDIRKLIKSVQGYGYSSILDYEGKYRPEAALLDKAVFDFIKTDLPPLQKVIGDAAAYYQELNPR